MTKPETTWEEIKQSPGYPSDARIQQGPVAVVLNTSPVMSVDRSVPKTRFKWTRFVPFLSCEKTDASAAAYVFPFVQALPSLW
jgi:hypothetical protein